MEAVLILNRNGRFSPEETGIPGMTHGELLLFCKVGRPRLGDSPHPFTRSVFVSYE